MNVLRAINSMRANAVYNGCQITSEEISFDHQQRMRHGEILRVDDFYLFEDERQQLWRVVVTSDTGTAMEVVELGYAPEVTMGYGPTIIEIIA